MLWFHLRIIQSPSSLTSIFFCSLFTIIISFVCLKDELCSLGIPFPATGAASHGLVVPMTMVFFSFIPTNAFAGEE